MARLVAAGLACRRGDRVLFAGLDLAVRRGQIVWLRGANGRGKTSLLRLLSGLSTPADGSIHWDGQRLSECSTAFRYQLLFIAHANGLKDDLTAIEALRFLARIHGRPAGQTDLEAALRTLGMANRRHAPVRTLSQGQRRRVALARLALDLAGPGNDGLWLLDEPYDALDSQGVAIVDTLLTAHCRRGGSVVLTSHQPLTIIDPVPVIVQLDAHQSGAPQAVAA